MVECYHKRIRSRIVSKYCTCVTIHLAYEVGQNVTDKCEFLSNCNKQSVHNVHGRSTTIKAMYWHTD